MSGSGRARSCRSCRRASAPSGWSRRSRRGAFERQRLDAKSIESVEAALHARRVRSLLGPVVDRPGRARHRRGPLVRRQAGAGRRDDRRRAGGLHGVSRQAVPADSGPGEGEHQHRPGVGRARAHQGRARCGRAAAALAACADARPRQRARRVPERALRLRPRSSRAHRRVLHRRTGSARRPGRPQRQRQVDARQPHPALLRSGLRHGRHRRRRRPRVHDAIAAAADRVRAPGHAAVLCAGLAEHRLWSAGRDARRHRPRGHAGAGGRVHRGDCQMATTPSSDRVG